MRSKSGHYPSSNNRSAGEPYEQYGVSAEKKESKTEAPELDYLPATVLNKDRPIGLIGAGAICEFHLKAYKSLGLKVVAICDPVEAAARKRAEAFYPQAEIFTDHQELLRSSAAELVDVSTHPEVRSGIMEDALNAGMHVLSQKPFVKDLSVGKRLIQLAESRKRKLAVNQNGRWAPHFRYMKQAVDGGFIGEVTTIDVCMQWDHTWVAGNPGFERIHHLVLYDFAIHWFDMVASMMGERLPARVYAGVRAFEGQKFGPPALAHVVIEYEGAQARLLFNAHNVCGEEDGTTITGTRGLLRSRGPRLTEQTVTLYTPEGTASPELRGDWFTQGFQGSMCELLASIEQDREPENNARANLRSLELAFAAIHSADTGQPQIPGQVTQIS